MKLRAVYMGTPEFSVPTLEMLSVHPDIELIGSISMPSRAAGRGQKIKDPEVVRFCKDHKIQCWQTENINKQIDLLDELETLNIDIIIVLAFAQFLGKRVLNLPKLGCFNIHTSLLPKYRGAAPIQYALLNGDKQTGVSIQKMVKKMDAGDLVLSHPIKISDNETGGQLYTRLKFQAALSCSDFIEKLISDDIHYESQNEDTVSFAPTLKKEDGFLDFENSDAFKILNQIRALKPWPGTYCHLNKDKLKIINANVSKTKIEAGKVEVQGNQILVGTQTLAISLEKIQLPGKKAIATQDFLNGHKGEIIINP